MSTTLKAAPASAIDPVLQYNSDWPPGEHLDMDNDSEDEDDEEEDYVAALERDRRVNDQRLKGRFEAIFAKYERDFTGVGDEIDMETGEIVVDNGHLANMEDEADPGANPSSDFVRAFAENLEQEAGVQTAEHDVDLEEVDGGDVESTTSEEEEEDFEHTGDGSFSAVEDDLESITSPSEADPTVLDPLLQELPTMACVRPSLPVNDDPQAERGSGTRERNDEHDLQLNVLEMPAVKASIMALKSQAQHGGSINADAIQALGMSIANQLAKFIGTGETNNKTSKKRKSACWDYPALPADKRRRSETPRQRPQLRGLSSVVSQDKRFGTNWQPQESLWAPIRHPRRHRKRRDVGIREAKAIEVAQQQYESEIQILEGGGGAVKLKKCCNCGICATTTWRRGPDGDLCNACGMYFYRYGLMKPPREPTPEPSEEARHDPMDDVQQLPGSKHTKFSVEEDALIIKLKEIDKMAWEKIGRHFEGRSAYAVQCRYAKNLVGKPGAGRNALIEQGFSFDAKPNLEQQVLDFTEHEDQLLLQLREDEGLDWADMVQHIPAHSADELERRYDDLNNMTPEGHSPARKKQRNTGPDRVRHVRFTKEEDTLIVKLREVDKLPWELISHQFVNRTSLAIQKRYVRQLANRKEVIAKGRPDPFAHVFAQLDEVDPDAADMRKAQMSLRSARFAESEDALLMRLADDLNTTWEEVAEHIPGRTINTLFNRYQVLRGKGWVDTNPDLTLEELKAHLEATLVEGCLPEDDVKDDDEVDDVASDTGLPFMPRGSKYTKAEDKIILKLKLEHDISWDQIAEHLPGRSAASVMSRWKKRLGIEHASPAHEQAADEDSLFVGQDSADQGPDHNSTPMADMENLYTSALPYVPRARSAHKWSTVEHDIVVRLKDQGMHWDDIAKHLPGRTAASVEDYWNIQFGPRKGKGLRGSPVEERARHILPASQSGPEALRRTRSSDTPERPAESMPASFDQNQALSLASRSPSLLQTPLQLSSGDGGLSLTPFLATTTVDTEAADGLSYVTPTTYESQPLPYYAAPPALMWREETPAAAEFEEQPIIKLHVQEVAGEPGSESSGLSRCETSVTSLEDEDFSTQLTEYSFDTIEPNLDDIGAESHLSKLGTGALDVDPFPHSNVSLDPRQAPNDSKIAMHNNAASTSGSQLVASHESVAGTTIGTALSSESALRMDLATEAERDHSAPAHDASTPLESSPRKSARVRKPSCRYGTSSDIYRDPESSPKSQLGRIAESEINLPKSSSPAFTRAGLSSRAPNDCVKRTYSGLSKVLRASSHDTQGVRSSSVGSDASGKRVVQTIAKQLDANDSEDELA